MRVSTRFSLSLENEQADAGPDGRTRLARPNSKSTNFMFFSVNWDTPKNIQVLDKIPYCVYCSLNGAPFSYKNRKPCLYIYFCYGPSNGY